MACKLWVAFVDGSFQEKEYLNHEIDEIEALAEQSPKEYIVRVEIEDKNEIVTYTYRRKTENVY